MNDLTAVCGALQSAMLLVMAWKLYRVTQQLQRERARLSLDLFLISRELRRKLNDSTGDSDNGGEPS